MIITKKEIKTEIHVEISREEFCDNYQAMMCDIIEKRWFDARVNVNTTNISKLMRRKETKWHKSHSHLFSELFMLEWSDISLRLREWMLTTTVLLIKRQAC